LAGLVATCVVIKFELGWAARTSAESGQLRADRDTGYEWLATPWNRQPHLAFRRTGCPGTARQHCEHSGTDEPEPVAKSAFAR
jgi:hypothetical protein